MRSLLRSVFTSDPSDSIDLLNRNYREINKTNIEFPHAEHEQIWKFIQDFFSAHGHVPDVSSICAYFRDKSANTIVDQAEIIRNERLLLRGDFVAHLNRKIEEQKKFKVSKILKTAHDIAKEGAPSEEGERFLIGPQDAVQYVIDRAHEILTPAGSVSLSGEAHSDVEEYKKEYSDRKNDEMLGLGQNTGIEQIDVVLRGAKKQELWTHAAFTGHLKSTLGLNWSYTQAVFYGQDVCYFSLEMPYHQCRRNYYTLHTIHDKFTPIRMELGLQEMETHPTCLSYQKIRDSELDEKEEQFFLEYVLEDLKNPDNHYGKVHFEVADPDKPDFTVLDLKARAEMIYARQPFSLIIIDHALLINPRKKYSNRTDQANEVMRDLKKLAGNFFRGAGIPVVALFQMNRQGYKKALEKNGMYDITALSYSNEVERSSDVITASWCEGVMKDEGRVLFQNLKTRDGVSFRPFLARIEWPCKRLLTCYDDYHDFLDEERRARMVREAEEATVEDLNLL